MVIFMYPRIRAQREDCDLSQTEMARLLHVSQATYSRYESGALDLPTQILISLADQHHTSIDYLLGRTDNPAPPENA